MTKPQFFPEGPWSLSDDELLSSYLPDPVYDEDGNPLPKEQWRTGTLPEGWVITFEIDPTWYAILEAVNKALLEKWETISIKTSDDIIVVKEHGEDVDVEP